MKNTQELLMSGYLATMGFNLPVDLVAEIVYPEKEVICISSDRGFVMVMEYFLTAVEYELPVKIFVFNNHGLGMIMSEEKMKIILIGILIFIIVICRICTKFRDY